MKGKLSKRQQDGRMNSFYLLSHNCSCGYCGCVTCSCSSDKITRYETSYQSSGQSNRFVTILQQ